ncbi:beta-N-acetylhexosaminidase [Gammaproteobacteria bacterium 42_54_T18]|nr:beta-N-acetylhexosaminidase [Gammaproteobacteria bacterium 42_54_T18]
MLDVEGLELTPLEVEILGRPGVGGLILFRRNFESVGQVKSLVSAIRAIRPDIIVAVDQEGGRVQRFQTGLTRLPALRVLGDAYESDKDGALSLAMDFGWLMAAEMLSLGVDISFAPVLDLDFGRSAVIGDRSIHRDPEIVIQVARAYIAGMQDAGMAATGKHFPGHGWVEADSHVAIPTDRRAEFVIASDDIKPFAALSQQLKGIMPAHVIYHQVDPQPAGFSPYWLQDVLRKQQQFSGVIFSDDLTMEGASMAGSYPERAQAAKEAGCDMVLVCNQFDKALEVLDWVEREAWQPDQQRLLGMRSQCLWDFDELKRTDRWCNTQQLMSKLV